MKKGISLFLVLILCLFAFSGCSGTENSRAPVSGENTPPSSQAVSGEESSSGSQAAPEESAQSGESSSAESGEEESGEAESGQATEGTLALYTWAGMFPPEVLEDFTKETGIEVDYKKFDSDETMFTRLQSAGGGKYDLVLADDYIMESVIQEGLAQKLDTEKIQNHESVDPRFQGLYYDPEDEYTVPFGAGVQAVVYDPEKTGKDITGYADLWDASLKDSVGVVANFRVVDGLALKKLGKSFNTEDAAALAEAGQELLDLAPNIRLIQDDGIQNALVSGELGAAVMYASQVSMAKLADPGLRVVFPKEGVGFGTQAMFVPSDAPNADAAYEFLSYLLRPEVSAKCFEFLGYYSTNLDANELISDEYQDFLVLPEEVAKDDMEMIRDVSDGAMEAHQRIWEAFRTACGGA